MVELLDQLGVSVLLRPREVSRILVAQSRAQGVELSDGRKILGDLSFVSNADTLRPMSVLIRT
jgi:NAD(P)H-nitrite reductase large subunit